VRRDDGDRDGGDPGFAAPTVVWPLTGRDDLLARMLGLAEAGRPGVVLTGPAGVGKTRLARTAAQQLARRGWPSEWAQATVANGDLPLGPFGHVLPVGIDAATPLDLLRRIAAALRARSRKHRLVLGVDDAHLLDPASATLVHQLASSGDVFVIATLRTGGQPPDAVVALWKDDLTTRFEIGELDEGDAATLLRTALNGEVEPATVHRLWSATRGNPLYLHELALAGLASGALARPGAVWRWRGPLSGERRLHDVLAARLAPLGSTHREALGLLAVGEPLGIDIFERLVGIDVVDSLERQELITIRRDDRREEASLVHPLYRELLTAAMSSGDRDRTRARLAAAVEAAGGRRRGDLLRIALWRQAGPGGATAELLIAAAAEAEARFDAELAERLARSAVDAGEPRAWSAVASSLRAQGRIEESDLAWRAALEHESDPGNRVAIAQSRSANLFFGLGAGERALAALEEVFPDATTQPLRDTIGSLVGMFDMYRGRIDAALATSLPILERGGVRGDAHIDAALTAAGSLALRGRPTEAIGVVDDNIGVALTDPTVSSIAAGALMAVRLLALSLDGQLDDALDAGRVIYDLAVDMGTHDGIAALSLAIGHLHEQRGDVATSRRHLVEGVELLREHDRNGYLPWCLAELTIVDVLGGRLDDAHAAAEEMGRVDRPELRLFWPRVETAKLLLLGTAHPDDAVHGLVATAEAAVADGHLMLAAMALHEAIRFGGAAAVADRLAGLAVATTSSLVPAFAAHAAAAAAEDPVALGEAADRFETMGALLYAAEAADRAAAAHLRRSERPAAIAAATRAAGLHARCPDAHPPWLARRQAPPPLSGRQQEIAVLAGRGMSSREIAGRLFVSVRTVDNHLYRIYRQLGVASREELAAVLGAIGLHDSE